MEDGSSYIVIETRYCAFAALLSQLESILDDVAIFYKWGKLRTNLVVFRCNKYYNQLKSETNSEIDALFWKKCITFANRFVYIVT